MKACRILGTGSYLPPEEMAVDNETLCRYFKKWRPEWVEQNTGIKERRCGFDLAANKMREGFYDSDLALKAAERALEAAGITGADLDLIVRVTCTPDYIHFPDSACVLHEQIGATHDCAAFTVTSGCGGLLYALKLVAGQVVGGCVKKALIVASNCSSAFMNVDPKVEESWTLPNSKNAYIFGDGASAMVVGDGEEGDHRILASYWGAWHPDDPMRYPAGGCKNPTRFKNVWEHWYEMDVKKVARWAGVHLQYAIEALKQRHPFELSEITWFLFHQANLRILEAFVGSMSISREKMLINLDRYGNTSAPSTGILLDEAVRKGKIKKGDRLLLAVIGAGWQYGALLIEW